MMRCAIIIFLVNYCAFLFSQTVQYTDVYDTDARLVPLQIVNTHPNYFYILRYNKPGHDFTVERRRKANGMMAAFTALRLDSVNEHWFDYEKLDYLFFEHNNRIYFVFEKVLNNRRAIYFKSIDTLGKSSGFKELAFLENNKATAQFGFTFKITGENKLLIVGRQAYYNGTVKKLVLLYDLEKREPIWMKKLPLENRATGFSHDFEVSAANDLFYVSIIYDAIVDSTDAYAQPERAYNLMAGFLPHNSDVGNSHVLPAAKKLSGITSAFLKPDGNRMLLLAHVLKKDSAGKDRSCFITQGFGISADVELYARTEPLTDDVRKKLTFYDGPEKHPEEKNYTTESSINAGGFNYTLAGRTDVNYYKELVLRKVNTRTGIIMSQEVIPRKVFYFDGRTRYHYLGVTSQAVCKGSWFCFVLENSRNIKKQPRDFHYHKFAKQEYLEGGSLVAYILRPDGLLEKKTLFLNEQFSYVPIHYTSNQNDFVFYLNNVSKEKFAILKLDEF